MMEIGFVAKRDFNTSALLVEANKRSFSMESSHRIIDLTDGQEIFIGTADDCDGWLILNQPQKVRAEVAG